MLRVLTVKPFLFLWLGQLLSQISLNMINFVLLLHIAQLTHSNLADSLFIITITLPAVIFGNIAGVIVEYFSKKQILFFCNILRIATVLSLLFVSDSIIWIYIMAIITSTINQFFVPAEAPLIPEIVPSKLLVAANSIFNLTFYICIVIGFMLAGPAIQIMGIKNIFIFCGLLFFVAALCIYLIPGAALNGIYIRLLQIRTKLIHLKAVHIVLSRLNNDFQEGVWYLRSNKTVIDSVILLSASQMGIAVIAAITPGYALTVLNIGVTEASLTLVAPAVIGMIFGSLIIGVINRKINFDKFTNICILSAGIMLVVMSLLSRGAYRTHINFYYLIKINILSISVFSMFILGVLNSFITVLANTSLQEKTAAGLRSRIYGIFTSMGAALSIIPVFTVGLLADTFGVVKVLFGMGLLVIIASIYKMKFKFNFHLTSYTQKT